MAKITTKAPLVRGTNYFYHLVDKQGTDIVINATGNTITSTTTDFTNTEAAVNGIIKRGIEVGDVIKVSNTANAANEGVELTVTVVAANQIDFTVLSGTPVDEVAGADMNITAFKKTYQWIEANGLSFVDGVSGLPWISQTVDDWDDDDLDIYDSVFTSIEPRAKALATKDGWEPHDIDTLLAHKDMALEIRPSANGTAVRGYALARSNDLDAATDEFTYWPNSQAELDAPLTTVEKGRINQLILLFDTENAIDNKGIWNFRCLEKDKTHLQEQIDMQYAEIYPVAAGNGPDPKLATTPVADATVTAGGIYADILYNIDVDSLYDGDVDSVLYPFTGFVDNDGQTNQDVHVKIHYLLRQAVNINNDGTGPVKRGDKQPPITSFLGDQLTFDKLYPLNFNPAERNNLVVIDNNEANQSWPKGMTLTIVPDALATTGTFSVIHEDTFGASSPTYLQNELAANQLDIAMPGSVGIAIAFSTYNVDGHTPNTPIPVRISYNRKGFIEPRNVKAVLDGSNQTVNISSVADPSYTAV